MELKIEGNPGTGNHYTEVKIGHIENNFPNVREVKIIKDADGKKTTVMSGDESSTGSGSETGDNDKDSKRADILKYVEKTLPFVLYQWKDKYMPLWNDILNLPEVDRIIYQRGRQQKTSFNRKEVLHIICFLGKHVIDGYGIFEAYNATHIAAAFCDGCEKTTRPELGFNTTKTIQVAIEKLMNSKKYAVNVE